MTIISLVMAITVQRLKIKIPYLHLPYPRRYPMLDQWAKHKALCQTKTDAIILSGTAHSSKAYTG